MPVLPLVALLAFALAAPASAAPIAPLGEQQQLTSPTDTSTPNESDVAWSEQAGAYLVVHSDTHDILAQRRSAVGLPIGEPIVLDATETDDYRPAVEPDPETGGWMVVWQ